MKSVSALRKTRNAKRPAKSAVFSNLTNVRNVYESVNPNTGVVTTNLNQYRVPIDIEYSPGYKKGIYNEQSSVKPKSSLTRAMRFMGSNSGLVKPLSSVPYNRNNSPEKRQLRRAAAERNLFKMKAQFGDKWVNAMVENEELTENYNNEVDNIIRDFEIQKTLLKQTLFNNTGINSEKTVEQQEAVLDEAFMLGKIDMATLMKKLDKISANVIHNVPEEHKAEYEKFKTKLEELKIRREENISRLRNEYESAMSSSAGNPISLGPPESRIRYRNSVSRKNHQNAMKPVLSNIKGRA